MNLTSQSILESFNQLPEVEKHELASEIIRSVVMLNFPPLTDEALAEVADALFIEHEEMEANDAQAETRGSLAG